MPIQSWSSRTYERNARFVSELGRDLLDLLAPGEGEHVLDLGCGDGTLTQEVVAAGCRVVGVDSSHELAGAARRRGLDVIVCRAESLPFVETFDAVLSNAVLHWIPDAQAALRSVHQALVPGGRVAAEMGGAGNIEAIRAALATALSRRGIDAGALDPWYFPTAGEYAAHLEECGFRVRSIVSFARPTPLPGGLADWVNTFAQPFLPSDDDERCRLVDEVCESASASLFREGRWFADYVRLRFVAERP